MKRFIAFVSVLWFLPAVVLAATVSVPQDTTLTLPADSTTYLLTSDSHFTSLTINSTSFDFVMTGGERVVLRSLTNRGLSNTLNTPVSCGTSESTVILEIPIDGVSRTVTVTPSATCSGGSGGGGGGGGSGGGGGYTSSTPIGATQTSTGTTSNTSNQSLGSLQAQLAALQQQIASVGGGVVGGFMRDMAMGSTGDDVEALQKLLAGDPSIYPEGTVSGYFGSLTVLAVRRFQAKHGLPQVGRVGPQTRAKLGEVSPGASTAPAGASTNAVSGAASFTRMLKLGDRYDDVRMLQQILARDSEIYPEGTISGYFGNLTITAVKRFQEKYGIATAGDPGYGTVGPKTRAKLNELGQTP